MSDDFYRKLEGSEHMPCVQANREYDDGYNAGIAAAIAKLKRIENDMRAESGGDEGLPGVVMRVVMDVIPKLARELESLFRNQVAPPSA